MNWKRTHTQTYNFLPRLLFNWFNIMHPSFNQKKQQHYEKLCLCCFCGCAKTKSKFLMVFALLEAINFGSVKWFLLQEKRKLKIQDKCTVRKPPRNFSFFFTVFKPYGRKIIQYHFFSTWINLFSNNLQILESHKLLFRSEKTHVVLVAAVQKPSISELKWDKALQSKPQIFTHTRHAQTFALKSIRWDKSYPLYQNVKFPQTS